MKKELELESHRRIEELVQRLEKEKGEALDSLKRDHLLSIQALQEETRKDEAQQRKVSQVSIEWHMKVHRRQCDEWKQEKINLQQSHKTAIRYTTYTGLS